MVELIYICFYQKRCVHHKQSLPFLSSMLRPLIVLLCRGVFFFGGFNWITVRGVRVSSKEAPIIAVAPHSSFFDSLALVYMDLTSVVAKSESKHIPIFGSRLFFLLLFFSFTFFSMAGHYFSWVFFWFLISFD